MLQQPSSHETTKHWPRRASDFLCSPHGTFVVLKLRKVSNKREWNSELEIKDRASWWSSGRFSCLRQSGEQFKKIQQSAPFCILAFGLSTSYSHYNLKNFITWMICQGVSSKDRACCLMKDDKPVVVLPRDPVVERPMLSASLRNFFLSALCLDWYSHFLFWNSTHSFLSSCLEW